MQEEWKYPSLNPPVRSAWAFLLRSGRHWGQFRHREEYQRSNRGIQEHTYAHTSRSSGLTLHADVPFFSLPAHGTRAPRARTVRGVFRQLQVPGALQSADEEIQYQANRRRASVFDPSSGYFARRTRLRHSTL